MSPRYSLRNRSRVYVSSDQRLKLNYDFAKHVIVTFQNSAAAYVQPFLEPVDPEKDDASDYYEVIRHPMDLATILQELEDGTYEHINDFWDSVKRIFSNCFRYNSPSSDVYKKGKRFQAAFASVWYGKDVWIRTEAAGSQSFSEEDITDDSSGILHDTSDDSQMEDTGESDEDTQEDDETSDDDLLSERDRRYVPDEDFSTHDDTTGNDTADDDRLGDTNKAEDETSEDDLPPVTRRRYLRKKSNLTGNHTPKAPEHRYRARKKDGSKHSLSIIDSASDLNTNHKRPLDTATEPQIHVQDHVASAEQSTESQTSPSFQQQSVPAEQVTKKPCLNIFQDHFRDSFQPPQIEQRATDQPQPEQSQTEPVQAEQTQSQQPPARLPAQEIGTPQLPQEPSTGSPSTSDPDPVQDPNPLKTMLASIVSTQIDKTTSQINANACGQYTRHLKLLEQLCNSNEKHEAFYEEWKTKALDKVSQMQVQDIMVRGVEKEVKLALAETVTEQARVFCEQVTSRAVSFVNSFCGNDGR